MRRIFSFILIVTLSLFAEASTNSFLIDANFSIVSFSFIDEAFAFEDVSINSLIDAAKSGDINRVKKFLKKGADINDKR